MAPKKKVVVVEKAAPTKAEVAKVETAVVAPKVAAKKSVKFDAPAPAASASKGKGKGKAAKKEAPAPVKKRRRLHQVKKQAAPAGVVVAKKQAAPAAKKAAPAPKKKAAPKKKGPAAAKRARKEEDDEEKKAAGGASSSDEDYSSDDEEDNLSDLADGSSSDDESEDGDKKDKKREKVEYSVVVLRHLPTEFQEPELYKFLGQFGARVTNCFCVRSKRTHESKGSAYVQFDNEAVLPTVVDECNGMALGGRTVRASIRVMHRPMPTKPNIRIRRLKGARHNAHGPLLNRHNVSEKPIMAQLIKYSRAEKKNNEALKALGIDYESTGFSEQLARAPKDLVLKKKERQDVAQVARLQRETVQKEKEARRFGNAAAAAAYAKKAAAAEAKKSGNGKKKPAAKKIVKK
ncbi:RNA-binding protein, putative [Bodo saltans]|uniref:RNA-binding protein, putative n=1 Tax=Bodo saltans TaxID=75058 RepID=A0A0S4JP72_BODSA|nr:RNA-binding protein, putative [Bodo saltans]|eukprot:CUG90894.1 RNA-binding protein, putative [Bodo saltans]